MPFRAPSICGCGRVVPPGQRCSCKIIADRERAKAQDAKRGNSRDRGYDTKWDRERSAFLVYHPVCAFCREPSKVVDHIIPHKGNMALFWNRSNWQPLCVHCHSSVKQKRERAL